MRRPPVSPRAVKVLSQVRTCDDCCPACRAGAADVLGEATSRCPDCGHPWLPELGLCPCARFIDEPPNPAAQQFHELAREVF